MFGWQLEGKKDEQTVLVVWNIAKKFKRKFQTEIPPLQGTDYRFRRNRLAVTTMFPFI